MASGAEERPLLTPITQVYASESLPLYTRDQGKCSDKFVVMFQLRSYTLVIIDQTLSIDSRESRYSPPSLF